MPRPLAPKAAIFVCLGLLAAAPVRAQSLYLDWLSGWSTSAPGDYLRIALDPETGIWGPAPVEQALQTSGMVPAPLIIHHPNGMVEMLVDPSVVEYVGVRIAAGGRPVFGHGPDPTTIPAVSGAPDR